MPPPATPRPRLALLRDASRKLDKAVSKGVIHKNQAANRKSAIAKRLADAVLLTYAHAIRFS